MSDDIAGFETRAVHVGANIDATTGAVLAPIYLSTTYEQTSVGQNNGYTYSRLRNPNLSQLESLLVSLELGRRDAVTFSSGAAAIAAAIQALGQNAHVVCVDDVYGGIIVCINQIAKQVQGLEVTFINLETSSDEEITASFRDNTKMVWLELATNPSLRVPYIPRIVRLARAHPSNPLVMVDNTFLSPFYLSPLLLRADDVMHSLTKYINDHSDVLMGALIVPSASTHPCAAAFAERARFL